MTVETALVKLAKSIGSFIDYWGFRGIHGQIWTVVFLSERPVNCTELTQILNVSKALVSPALRELEDYLLVEIVADPTNSKEKRYVANPGVFKIIKSILKNRETLLLQKIRAEFVELENLQSVTPIAGEFQFNQKRMQLLKEMIIYANFAIGVITSLSSLSEIPKRFRRKGPAAETVNSK